MDRELNGRVAFIMGASRGMGRAISLRLAGAGALIAAAARNADQLDSLKSEIEAAGGRCRVFVLDVLDYEGLDAALRETEKVLGNITIFYNGVGIAPAGSIESLSIEQINHVLDINIKGMIYGTKTAIPYLKKNGGGNIVNVSSMAATRGLGTAPDYNGIYTATKWALNGFDECMEKYLVNDNIRVSTLCPGSTYTSLWENVPLPFPAEEMIPVEYVAEVVEMILRAPDSVVFKQARFCAAVEINNF